MRRPAPPGRVAVSGRGRLHTQGSPALPCVLDAVRFIFLAPSTVSCVQYVLNRYLPITVERGWGETEAGARPGALSVFVCICLQNAPVCPARRCLTRLRPELAKAGLDAAGHPSQHREKSSC